MYLWKYQATYVADIPSSHYFYQFALLFDALPIHFLQDATIYCFSYNTRLTSSVFLHGTHEITHKRYYHHFCYSVVIKTVALMLIKTVSLMLEKRNWMQWRKLMHRTYTFTPASSYQRVHRAFKVIVEPRLCFSSIPVHCSLSHVWQSIPEYWEKKSDGSLFSRMPYPCSFSLRVVLDMLYSPPIHSNLYFSMTDVFIVSIFSLQSHFYPLPLFLWTVSVSKWWTF